MNMQSTEYFIVLARERSFTRAAEALHITQQSLSAHIAALEEEFGTQLVVRRVPLELTYAGRVFLRRSEKIQKEYSELRKEMWGIAGEARGEIRVGIAVGRSRVLMPDVITAFQREYPNVSIMLIEESNDKLHRAALYGEIDIAISNFPASVPMLELRDFYIEGVALVIPRVLLDQCGIDAESCRKEIRLSVRHGRFEQYCGARRNGGAAPRRALGARQSIFEQSGHAARTVRAQRRRVLLLRHAAARAADGPAA